MEARKRSPSIAPSKPPGAVSPVTRTAARTVLVCQRPPGAWSWTRAPRGARPYRRSRWVVMPVSSRHPRWATSQVGAAACHATRAAATSGRSCSDGRTGFFNGQAEGPHGAPGRRHTRGRPSAQPACDPGAPQSARPRCVGAAQACRAVPVAGREAPPRPFRAAAVAVAAPTTRARGIRRHLGRLHPGIAVEERPLSQIHRIGTQRPSSIGARRSTTTAPGSTRPI